MSGVTKASFVKTLRPGQKGHQFEDGFSNAHFWKKVIAFDSNFIIVCFYASNRLKLNIGPTEPQLS